MQPLRRAVQLIATLMLALTISACGLGTPTSTLDHESETSRQLFEKYNYFSIEDVKENGGFFDYSDAANLLRLGYETRPAYESALTERLKADFARNKVRLYGTDTCREARRTQDHYTQGAELQNAADKWGRLLDELCGTEKFSEDTMYRWAPAFTPSMAHCLPSKNSLYRSDQEKKDLGSGNLELSRSAYETVTTLLPALSHPSKLEEFLKNSPDLLVTAYLTVVDNYCGERGARKREFDALSVYDVESEREKIAARERQIIRDVEIDSSTLDHFQYLKFRARAKFGIPKKISDRFEFDLRDLPPALISHDGWCAYLFEDQFAPTWLGLPDAMTVKISNPSHGRALEEEFVYLNRDDSNPRDPFGSQAYAWVIFSTIVSGVNTEPVESKGHNCEVLLKLQAIEVASIKAADPNGMHGRTLFFTDVPSNFLKATE
jgi:hypothetical protein